MSDDELQELKDVLEIAFGILTDEQWKEYQRRRRERFIQRCNERAKKAA